MISVATGSYVRCARGRAGIAKLVEAKPIYSAVAGDGLGQLLVVGGLGACTGEWKLLCGNHNLLKLWRHQTTGPLATPTTT